MPHSAISDAPIPVLDPAPNGAKHTRPVPRQKRNSQSFSRPARIVLGRFRRYFITIAIRSLGFRLQPWSVLSRVPGRGPGVEPATMLHACIAPSHMWVTTVVARSLCRLYIYPSDPNNLFDPFVNFIKSQPLCTSITIVLFLSSNRVTTCTEHTVALIATHTTGPPTPGTRRHMLPAVPSAPVPTPTKTGPKSQIWRREDASRIGLPSETTVCLTCC